MVDYAKRAADRGLQVIVAGAGGAAHLPGMTASLTPLPVIGVPVPLQQLDGLDSLLSIVQMPGGIPVATVAVGNAKNAGLLAMRILSTADDSFCATMAKYQADARGDDLREGRRRPQTLRLRLSPSHARRRTTARFRRCVARSLRPFRTTSRGPVR